MPTQEDVVSIIDEIRILGANTQKRGSDHEQINRLITWYSRRLTGSDADESNGNEPENRVASVWYSGNIRCCLVHGWLSEHLLFL